ncbi:transmembrane and ubiquitin-like domain-containing protein 1 isoform X2 [Calliopsis andreniformis]|uniref:transmembrane and ubiquitin-like domain-containing protein 1 isoform X2 n=1 Tax=Calliopsis andreniformis TaxID=337506 RepID=UPI003FCD4F98
MTLIDGVGDEVTDFFIVVVVLLVGWLAWCSTSITDQPFIRTVLILRHGERTHIAELRANRQNTSSLNQPSNIETSVEESIEPIADDNTDNSQSCPEPSITEVRRTSEATATEEVLIETMDSFNSDNTTLLKRQTKVNKSEETNISTCSDTVECESKNLSTSDANEISIKLKFINDDQKVVTGSLKELLGDFKRRHFQIELEAQRLVRLVFKGRVLQPDSQTLERCGLYNNCVVHCLVHQPRPSTLDSSSSIYFNPQSSSDTPTSTSTSTGSTSSTPTSLTHNEWDLSRFLVSILTLMLGLAWYSRYHYAQLFTATTTLALCALTAILIVFLFSNFFPDQDNLIL